MNNYVKTFQKAIGVYDDGLFGPKTLEAALAAIVNKNDSDAPVHFPSSFFPKLSRPVDELIWHTSATPEGREISVDTIRGWHKDGRGWSDIGYHYVVHLDGSVEAGRPLNKIGAHVSGHNRRTIGACYIGGMNAKMTVAKDTRTPAQKAAMVALTKELISRYNLTEISGHNQYANKACPSFPVRSDEIGNINGFYRGKKVK